MERGISDRNILERFASEFCAVVERHCPYIIVSGFVAISLGRARSTEDIDMIIPKITEKVFASLHKDLILCGFECMQSDSASEVFGYLNDKASVRYVWKDKMLPEMEIKFAKDSLDDYQLKTRKRILRTGLDLWFSSIEMNVAFKEEYLRSDKDMEDARHLRMVYKGELSEDEITNIKKMIRTVRR
jgi:hypothetical protein